MKCSSLVLGISISLSLCFQMCCALDANTLQLTDLERIGDNDFTTLFSGSADEAYEKVLKFIMSTSVSDPRDLGQLQTTNKIVDTWLKDTRSGGFRELRDADSQTLSGKRISSKNTGRHDKMHFNLCGPVDPPDFGIPECAGVGCGNEYSDEPPEGCEFDESVSYMKCNDRSVTDIPPLPAHLDILDLNKTRIEKLPELAFRNVSIKNIRLFDNTIDYIHPWAFHDVESLANLMIVNNLIEYLAFEIYVGLNQTTNLDLQKNLISFEIYKNCPLRPVDEILPVLPKLVIMTLSGNPLKIIPKQMFAGLRNSPLRMLYLEACFLEEIHAEAFTFLPNLRILNLNRNPQLIPKLATALEGIESLTTIYLSHNGLSRIPTEALSRFAGHIETLELNGNYISSVSKEEMSHFPNLRHLYMDDSGILTIDEDAFEDLTEVRTISLRNSRILQLPTHLPQSLQILRLMNNNAVMIRAGFQNLTKLEMLELQGIQLERIHNDTFLGLTSLENLVLGKCNIKYIDENAFQDLSKVKSLFLEDNLVSELAPGMFYGLESLLQLNIKNCNLTFSEFSQKTTLEDPTVPESPFRYLTNMNTILLTGNKISSISKNLFEGLPSLRSIDISNNPIQSWETRLFLSQTEAARNGSLILQLHIVHGELRTLTDAMIEDFQYMTEIDLSHNTFACDLGACKLRDIIKSSITASNQTQTWINSDTYECVDLWSEDNARYKIMNVTDETCAKTELPSVPPQSPGLEEPPTSGVILVIALTASLSLVAVVIIILAYRNRTRVSNLRYFLFD